jgi:hypothetical protein
MASQETTPGYDPWLDVIGIQHKIQKQLENDMGNAWGVQKCHMRGSISKTKMKNT